MPGEVKGSLRRQTDGAKIHHSNQNPKTPSAMYIFYDDINKKSDKTSRRQRKGIEKKSKESMIFGL